MSGMENGKHASVIYQHRQDGWERQEVWPIDLFKVDRIGLFGHIIHCSVFESIQSPWYEGWDECYAFCDKVRAAGFDIWADGRAPFGHIGQYVVDGLPEE